MLTHASVVVENAMYEDVALDEGSPRQGRGRSGDRPDQAGVIFECRVLRRTPGRLRTRVTT
jgi:hypothetical protein